LPETTTNQPDNARGGRAGVALPFRHIAPLMHDCVERGVGVRVKVHGRSMRPFILHGDTVELRSCRGRRLCAGDIVLVRRDDDSHVLHRITRTTADRFYLCGDAQSREEGPFHLEQAAALATALVRGEQDIPLGDGFRRWSGTLWGRVLPARRFLLDRRDRLPGKAALWLWRLLQPRPTSEPSRAPLAADR